MWGGLYALVTGNGLRDINAEAEGRDLLSFFNWLRSTEEVCIR